MKSYIKIYGPPIGKALKALEKVATEMPEHLIVSYYDTIVPTPGIRYETDLQNYMTRLPEEVSKTRMAKLISKSGHTLGEYDFFFEWARNPTWEEIDNLIEKIDEALSPLGCRYTIVSK